MLCGPTQEGKHSSSTCMMGWWGGTAPAHPRLPKIQCGVRSPLFDPPHENLYNLYYLAYVFNGPREPKLSLVLVSIRRTPWLTPSIWS